MLGFALAKFRGDSLKLLPHGCVVNVEIAETGGNGNLADAFSGLAFEFGQFCLDAVQLGSLSALRSDKVFRAIVTAPFVIVGYARVMLAPCDAGREGTALV